MTAVAVPLRPRVLVVGGGPVGLAMGFLLDRVFRVPARVVERQTQPTAHPQAHFLNLRTMEVLLAAAPAFHDRLRASAAPSELWRDYIYCTGVGRAREFARIDQFGPCIPRSSASLVDALSGVSPTQFLHFPQNRFEAMLAEFLHDSGMQVDRGVELVDLRLDAAGLPHVSLRNMETQQVEHATFDYVIGADGASSLVRQFCGVDMAGAANLQSIANVHFTSKALSEAARENPAMLYFVFNKDVIGVLIAHDLSRGEWVFQIPFFPPQESVDWDFSTRQCIDIVKRILPEQHKAGGDGDTQILSVGQWRMSARVAKQYDVQRRVFLVGDAAHQFPPAGGLGMNTGIQDAHNLAWKLALAIQQEQQQLPQQQVHDTSTRATSSRRHQQQDLGGPNDSVDTSALLRSYERERQLVAKINTQLSLRNVERTMKVPTALNVSHNSAKLLASVVNSAPVKFLPLRLQRDVVQSMMQVGKSPLALLDAVGTRKDGGGDGASSAIGGFMRRQVQRIVESRASLGMLFYHFDVGFSYATSSGWRERAKSLMEDSALDQSALFTNASSTAPATASTGSNSLPHSSTLSSESPANTDGVFAPKFRVGERFPHFWLSGAGNVAKDGEAEHRESSLVLNRRVMELQRERVGSVLFLLVVDGKQLQQKSGSSRPALNTVASTLLEHHVALVVLDTDDDIGGNTDNIKSTESTESTKSTERTNGYNSAHNAVHAATPEARTRTQTLLDECSFASVHQWRVDSADALSRSKWSEFQASHSAALVRPDGHVGFLWDSSAPPRSVESVLAALHHAYTLSF